MKAELLRDLIAIAEEATEYSRDSISQRKRYGDREAATHEVQWLRGVNSTIRAARRELTQMEHGYTVLLLYPDYLSSNYGEETFLAHVSADSAGAAIERARKEVLRVNEWTEADAGLDDFAVLMAMRGIHDDLSGEVLC